MRELGIEFREHLLRFGDKAAWAEYLRVCPTGKVPCLFDGGRAVWDSLSIAEYLAEKHPGVWPAEADERAWARSAAAEMHSGFFDLRSNCSMSCGVRMRLKVRPPGLERDIRRLQELWQDGLHRFGGPYLAGDVFTAADAFFAPVAFRTQTYGLTFGSAGDDYVERLLELPSMRQWYSDALEETFRDESHEREMGAVGVIVEDRRRR
jgi:glutathione S-transferase